MSDMDDVFRNAIQQGFREINAQIQAAASAEDVERAIGWTVVVTDPTLSNPTPRIHGFYEDPVEAFHGCERINSTLNADLVADGAEPVLISVYPVLPIT